MTEIKNLKAFRLALLCLTGFILVSAGIAWSQVTTATFYGIVTDPTGAVVPGAAVTLTQDETATATNKTADASGEFTFDFLHAGTYTLKIEAPGFKTYTGRGIVLSASQRFRGTFALEVGNVAESVNVEAYT